MKLGKTFFASILLFTSLSLAEDFPSGNTNVPNDNANLEDEFEKGFSKDKGMSEEG